MSKKVISMPTYVIIEKRDFENLFETVDNDGQELTALNVKKENKTSETSGVRVRGSSRKKERAKPYDRPKKRRRKPEVGNIESPREHNRCRSHSPKRSPGRFRDVGSQTSGAESPAESRVESCADTSTESQSRPSPAKLGYSSLSDSE